MMEAVYYQKSGPVDNLLPLTAPYESTPNVKQWVLNRVKRILKRHGIDAYLMQREPVKIQIRSDRLSEVIMEMKCNLVQLFHEPHYLLMGVVQFGDLVSDPDNFHLLSGTYDAPVDIRHSQYGRIYNMEIKVVPGFDGVALIPKNL